jgi:two-component system NtrC family sensor kinase
MSSKTPWFPGQLSVTESSQFSEPNLESRVLRLQQMADGKQVIALQLQRQVQLSNLVSRINNEIRSTLDLNEVLNSACRILSQVFDCSRASILITEPGEQKTMVCCGEYSQGDYPVQMGSRIPIEGNSHLRALMQQSGALAVTHFLEFPGLSEQTRHAAEALEIRSVLATAMWYRGQVNGIIELHQCDRQREWLDWEQQLLEEVGNQVAIAINQAKIYSETRHQVERESLLRLVTNQIRSTLDLDTILQTIVREVRQLLDTDRVVVYQFFEDWQGSVVVEDVAEAWESVLGEMGQDNCFSGNYANLYQGGRVRAINNILHAGLDACHVNFLQRLQVQANLIVPILIGTKLWGLLIAHECRDSRVWQNWEMELLQQLANQVAIAIHQAELHAQVQASALQAQSQAQQLEQVLHDLRETQAQLIQTEKLSSLGQMVAGIAHELNNATTFIYANLPYAQTYAESLIEALTLYKTICPDPLEAIAQIHHRSELAFVREDFPNLLQSMKVGADRLKELVLTLRNFARLDEAARKPVDLHEGIESTLVLLQHRLRTGVKIHKQYGDLPQVECRAGQLNQVFLNLLNNALDAAGSTAEITIHTWHSSDSVVVAIRDNGPGVPLEIQSKIFDPFFTTKAVGQGTGLGLSIAHRIVVEGHNGQLRCISQPGQGAEFQVELPLMN